MLGLVLVVQTTSGAVLLYRSELFRAMHSAFYEHTASVAPLTAAQAVDLVTRAHPDFVPAWVSEDHGVLAVGDAGYSHAYGVDPGSGRITGYVDLDGGVLGFLTNLHDCGLTCAGSPGTLSWLATPLPTLHLGFYDEETVGGAIVAVLGLLMILLAVSGLVVWWPGRKRLSHGFRVRLGKGRFARDYDLHNVIGIVSVPFVLMWGVTGAAFELPGVENAWLVLTGGHETQEAEPFTAADRGDASDIGVDAAVATASTLLPGDDVRYVALPAEGAAYYQVNLASSLGPFEYRAFFGGDDTVYVDAHDATHAQVVTNGGKAASNSFYDSVFEPSHFGWNVNAWWRIGWVVMGLTPLALLATGVSTWLYRRGVTKRRKIARVARASS